MTPFATPKAITTAEYEIKKSRFYALGGPVLNADDFKALLAQSRQTHPKAGHHCWAYQIGAPGLATQDSSDDGEPRGTAGKPILAHLQGANAGQCAVVVARYFGGVKLGTGGLVRAYAEATRQWIEQADWQEVAPQYRLIVSFPYSLAGVVEGWTREWSVSVVDQCFADNIRQIWSGPLDQQRNVIQSIEQRAHLGLVLDRLN